MKASVPKQGMRPKAKNSDKVLNCRLQFNVSVKCADALFRKTAVGIAAERNAVTQYFHCHGPAQMMTF